MIADLKIRACQEKDVALLEKTIPTGANQYHLRRFRNQQKGGNTYVIAFLDDEPVGHLDLIWDPSSSQEAVIKQLNDCPELNAIVVVTELRSQGIGSRLISFAEGLAAERGYCRVCLGVATNNPRAKSLYERVGYEDWGQGITEDSFLWLDENGRSVEVTEQVLCLIKAVKPAPELEQDG